MFCTFNDQFSVSLAASGLQLSLPSLSTDWYRWVVDKHDRHSSGCFGKEVLLVLLQKKKKKNQPIQSKIYFSSDKNRLDVDNLWLRRGLWCLVSLLADIVANTWAKNNQSPAALVACALQRWVYRLSTAPSHAFVHSLNTLYVYWSVLCKPCYIRPAVESPQLIHSAMHARGG